MASKHVNRQATRRISIPVTVCLTLLASCVSKPIEQDLASGDATVEIKYLDSMTVDIIDDIRMKRRDFYKNALDNPKKYEQGIQGAVDRVSTFAAAINANAQRDKSVLDRYHAESDRQLSALENSEELGDAVLAQNKKYIEQMSTMNEYSLEERKSNLDAKKAMNEAGADLARSSVDAHNALVDGYKTQASILQDEIKEIDFEIQEMKAAGKDIKAKEAEKDIKVNELNRVLVNLNTINGTIINKLGAVGTTGSTGLAGVVAGTGGSAGTGHVAYPGKITSNVNNIIGVPGVVGPTGKDYIKNAAATLDNTKESLKSLANSDTDSAMLKADKVLAPPIERIRNDEAVLDYLLDGYRDTQIYSGAEYGGMVRRVLPFSFVFTPGSNTQSGFGARVVLKPDQEQIEAAAAMIAPHLNAVNRDRLKGYSQRYEAAEIKINGEEVERNSLTRGLLYHTWNTSECKMIPSNETNTDSDEFPWNIFNASLDKSGFFHGNDRNTFWRAYSVSINALREALEDAARGKLGQRKYGTSMYEYDLTSVAGEIYSLLKEVKNIKLTGSPESGASVYKLALPDFANYMHSSLSEICQIRKMIGIDINGGFSSEDDVKINKLVNIIDNTIVSMTSSGLVYDLHLSSNPLFSAQKNDSNAIKRNKRTISIVKEQDEYRAKFMEITQDSENLKKAIAFSAQPRIVQNTSREHVVEIADAAKMNTLLSAAVTANEVSNKLGLNIGGEIASALSSASAFIKRIPYAVPFTGQSFSMEKKNLIDQSENQTFGWKYYKTPSGATQMGSITQSFKTTPLNSAVVVSMPEWMNRLSVEYQISNDGKNWEKAGEEDILLSGASLRGVLSRSGTLNFDSWVKYHIYREADGSVGMPQLKSCYGEDKESNIIYGNSKGDTAICGENLHGVKGVLVAGRYIDEIEKVSSNLIKVKSFRLDPNECAALRFWST